MKLVQSFPFSVNEDITVTLASGVDGTWIVPAIMLEAKLSPFAGRSNMDPFKPYLPRPFIDESDRRARRIAYAAAENSRDPSTRCGAVVYQDNEILGIGWNRFPNNTPPEYWNDRALKYAYVIHAEVAAMIEAGRSARSATLAATHHPCRSCAVLMAEFGIRRAVFPQRIWREHPDVKRLCEDADIVLARAGIEVVYVD